VASLLLLSTDFFFYPILNTITSAAGLDLPGPVVRIDTNARDQWPGHPFIHAQDKFAARFGSATSVAMGLVVKEGTIFTPEPLAKIDRITKSIDGIEASDALPAYDSQTDARDEARGRVEEEAGDPARRREREPLAGAEAPRDAERTPCARWSARTRP
jgi:hypothetical protein